MTECQAKNLPDKRFLIDVIKVTMIQVKRDIFITEANLFPEGSSLYGDRKGFWFVRGIRTIGCAKRLGHNFHDRTNSVCERHRMLISFSEKSDELVGSKFNKQMDDNALPCLSLSSALLTLYRGLSNNWAPKKSSQAEAQAEAPKPSSQAEATKPSLQAEAPKPSLQAQPTKPSPQAEAPKPLPQAEAPKPSPEPAKPSPEPAKPSPQATKPSPQAEAPKPSPQATKPLLQAEAPKPAHANMTKPELGYTVQDFKRNNDFNINVHHLTDEKYYELVKMLVEYGINIRI